MQKEYIFCHTVSGEGYSEPEFKAFSDKNIAEGYLSEKLNQTEQQTDGRVRRINNDKFIVVVGEDEEVEGSGDYHMLQIIEVPAMDYHLICATEPNEVEIEASASAKELILASMESRIASQGWNEDEEEWDGGNSYGAHATDSYVHYEIVSATQVLVETLPDEPEGKKFPNGFQSWQETHFEVVQAITLVPEDAWNRVTNTRAMQGTGGLYELAEELTDEFEKLHEGKNWDGEFFDAIEEFLQEKFKGE